MSLDIHYCRLDRVIKGVIFAPLLLVAACEPAYEVPPEGPDEEAVEIWSHPDSVGIEIYAPMDLKAESRDVAWGLDRVADAIMRFEPAAGQFGVFGFLSSEPSQVADPIRLAVSESAGIIAYDDSSRSVDLFTFGGQHVRGFEPGFRPSILEVARRPLRLTFGIVSVSEDSVPRMTVIQTDFLGENPDTLLGPGSGPESLRTVTARRGLLSATPSESGLWLYSAEVPDTVFEVSALGPGRKLVLPESDARRVGVLSDRDEQVLWVVTPRAEGGLDYEAFDLSATEVGEQVEAAPRYLGARVTPVGFAVQVAVEGAVIGWWNTRGSKVVPRAYDMRLEELRDEADEARAGRQARREDNTRKWEIREEAEADAEAEALRAEPAS